MKSLNKEIEETCALLSVEDCFADPQDDINLSDFPNLCPDSEPGTTTYQICECPNPAKGMYLRNTVDGRKLLLNCNKYQCPYCGKFKARKLYAGMLKYFKQFEYIRLWTLTLSSRFMSSKLEHYKILQETWRRFMIEVRRNKILTKSQRDIQYVRVSEYHDGKKGFYNDVNNKGYIHFHILVTQYIPVAMCQSLLNHITYELTGIQEKIFNINMKGMQAHENAAHYVVKYVMKSAAMLSVHQKKWTKSGKISIFDKRVSSGEWKLMIAGIDESEQFVEIEVLASYTCKNLSTTSQTIKNSGLPPPPILRLPGLENSTSRIGIDRYL
jgi:hypothetical protein